jgi:stage II sporulation protein D
MTDERHPHHAERGWLHEEPVRSREAFDQQRRLFIAGATALSALAILTGCDPPSSRDGRRLPRATDELEPPPGEALTSGTEPKPPPPPRMIQRPLPPTSEPIVRVRIATVRAPVRVIRIDGDGGSVLIDQGDGLPAKTVALPASVESTIGGWVVIAAVGTRNAATFSFASPSIEVRPTAGAGRGVRLAKDIAACGSLPWGVRLVARTDEAIGAVDVVTHVPMEQYLPGVLAKELYNTWSLQTHLAQAVAARSYAVCEIAQSLDSHFDVVAGEASQAWIGVTNHKASLDAVRQTRGMVMIWDRRVVPAYYSSTCGGRPANASDAIANNEFNAIAPLQVTSAMARDCCRAAPQWRWSMRMPLPETARRLSGWAKTDRPVMARIEGIRNIEVFTVNAVGRPLAFRITDAKNQVFEVPAERLRWAFNADVPGVPAPTGRVKSADFTAKVSGTSITLEGRGFGHGVGMCQYGAEALSKKGQTWRDILARYYPGSEVFATYAAKA